MLQQAEWDISLHQELDIRERLATLGTEGGKMRIEGKKRNTSKVTLCL
ncbi:MAG TPA: hypothetical protein VLK82_12170 [Candidatus Tectomicrobia bacterium]|nr:hypothetical protein [Candidatus Tectomicrobia bacterium]